MFLFNIHTLLLVILAFRYQKPVPSHSPQTEKEGRFLSPRFFFTSVLTFLLLSASGASTSVLSLTYFPLPYEEPDLCWGQPFWGLHPTGTSRGPQGCIPVSHQTVKGVSVPSSGAAIFALNVLHVVLIWFMDTEHVFLGPHRIRDPRNCSSPPWHMVKIGPFFLTSTDFSQYAEKKLG